MPLALIMVGLPARGKSYTAQKIARYFEWLGNRSKVFNVGNTRRQISGAFVPHDFFNPQNTEGLKARQQAAQKVMSEMIQWLQQGGEVGILDATNSTKQRRDWVLQQLQRVNIDCVFIESLCDDSDIIDENIRRTKLSSPDYAGIIESEALVDFRQRIQHYETAYETLRADQIPWIKIVNAGRQVILNRLQGPLMMKLGAFLMNLNLLPSSIWLSRHGQSVFNTQNRVGGDSDLSAQGRLYAQSLNHFMMDVNVEEVWTSTLKRTIQTASGLSRPIQRWKILDEIHAGTCDGLTYDEIQTQHPQIAEGRANDKLRYRYPQGESYEDVIQRVDPILLALEHRQEPVLVVAHQAILRVIYGYFSGKQRDTVPKLHIPLHTIIHLKPSTYGCEEMRFALPPHLEYN